MCSLLWFFFFNDTATTEIYTLSLHDASSDLQHDDVPSLPIAPAGCEPGMVQNAVQYSVRHGFAGERSGRRRRADRKSTRLNSSHANISYAVFCLKKKKNDITSLVSHDYVHLL